MILNLAYLLLTLGVLFSPYQSVLHTYIQCAKDDPVEEAIYFIEIKKEDSRIATTRIIGNISTTLKSAITHNIQCLNDDPSITLKESASFLVFKQLTDIDVIHRTKIIQAFIQKNRIQAEFDILLFSHQKGSIICTMDPVNYFIDYMPTLPLRIQAKSFVLIE